MTQVSQPQAVTNQHILAELKDWHREVLQTFAEIEKLKARIERLEQAQFGREVVKP